MGWRPQDEALLSRIENERLIVELWARDSGGAEPLHPRASGLIEALKPAVDAKVAAADGELEALLRAVQHAPLAGAAPALLHSLAVYQTRLAAAVAQDGSRWIEAQLRAMTAWLALVEEGSYLRAMGEAQYPAEGAQVALEVWRRPLAELGAVAKGDARTLGERGQWAIRALSRMGEAARAAGCATTLARAVEREAERQRTTAVEQALAVVADALHEATARGAAERDGPGLSASLARIWAWSEWDEHVERFAIDELTPIAWNIYQTEEGFSGLRALLKPVEPLVDNLVLRLARDSSRIAYAAPLAQMLVFRSEMSLAAATRRTWAERAVEVCPTHRNGRLILARTLAHEVRDKLDGGFTTQLDKKELLGMVQRARELYPRTKNLDDLERRIEELPWWRGR